MSDEEKLELVQQMCRDQKAQDTLQMLKHEDEVSDIICSIQDIDIKMKAVREYHNMHEEYATMIFSHDFGISTNDRKFNLEDVLDSHFGKNIAEIARTINDDEAKIRLIDNYALQMTGDDINSIISTIKSDVRRKEAESIYSVYTITPEELANNEKVREASDTFDKEASEDILGKDKNTLEEQNDGNR